MSSKRLYLKFVEKNVVGKIDMYWENAPVTVLAPLTAAGEVTVTLVATLLPSFSVNQMLPSGPTAIQAVPLGTVGTGNSVMVPARLMRPIRPEYSVSQRLPSAA